MHNMKSGKYLGTTIEANIYDLPYLRSSVVHLVQREKNRAPGLAVFTNTG